MPPKKFYHFWDRFMWEFMSSIALFYHEFGMISSGVDGFITFYHGGFFRFQLRFKDHCFPRDTVYILSLGNLRKEKTECKNRQQQKNFFPVRF